jgi:hypothetical protein
MRRSWHSTGGSPADSSVSAAVAGTPRPMTSTSRVSRSLSTTSDRVWDVLADGWLYPLWVVGAARTRDVDDTWPAVGSRIHHSVGVWPALINDETEVLEQHPGRSIRLRAAAWPLGAAEVLIVLTPSGSHTDVEIREGPVSGPGTLVPRPLLAPALTWRNVEALRRLAHIAAQRSVLASAAEA